MLELTDPIKQVDTTDIYITCHPNTNEYTSFQSLMEFSPKLGTHVDTKKISTGISKVK